MAVDRAKDQTYFLSQISQVYYIIHVVCIILCVCVCVEVSGEECVSSGRTGEGRGERDSHRGWVRTHRQTERGKFTPFLISVSSISAEYGPVFYWEEGFPPLYQRGEVIIEMSN